MKKIKIAGVPEHFNAPWKYALEKNLFSEKGLRVEFLEYRTGTGAMCRDLSKGVLDMALVLTEGIAAFQKQEPSLKIISTYVESPLNWGIHVSEQSSIESIKDLKNKTFAISRFGSGSHLMVKLLAKQQNWRFDQIKFLEVGCIDNLGTALQENKADVFLWEVFTTKPYLKKYDLRLLDILPTPWPCFQLVSSGNFAKEKKVIKLICDIIFPLCKLFNENHELAKKVIRQYYNLNPTDIDAWLKQVRWAEKSNLLDFTTYDLI